MFIKTLSQTCCRSFTTCLLFVFLSFAVKLECLSHIKNHQYKKWPSLKANKWKNDLLAKKKKVLIGSATEGSTWIMAMNWKLFYNIVLYYKLYCFISRFWLIGLAAVTGMFLLYRISVIMGKQIRVALIVARVIILYQKSCLSLHFKEFL